MPSPLWCTEAQTTFLESRLQEYKSFQEVGSYVTFWPTLYEEWFQEYPERGVLWPDQSLLEELSADNKVLLGKAITRRRDVCRVNLLTDGMFDLMSFSNLSHGFAGEPVIESAPLERTMTKP